MKSRPQIALAIALVLAVLGLSFGLRWARAQTPDQAQPAGSPPTRTVSVSGAGQVNVKPDYALVQLGVQTDADTASAALSQNNQQMQSLLQALKAAGVAAEDIQTQTVQLNPRYDQSGPQGGSPRLSGYTAVNTVQVRVRDLDKLGSLLDASVEAGGNTIQGIQFQVSDPASALDQARQAAMQEAKHKAEQLASLAGAELGDVLSINESSNAPQPVMRTLAIAQMAAVPVEPGTQSLEVDVQVTWLLK